MATSTAFEGMSPTFGDTSAEDARPRFSLLMPTKDRPDELAQAIEAIRAQDFESWELVIKDGGDARGVIPRDERITYLRGPERNLAHALNIAMTRASGQIFNWANDDDPLLPGALSYVDASIGTAMWLRGRVKVVDRIYGRGRIEATEPWDIQRLKLQAPLWTPSVFWRSEAAMAVGLMDESVPLACDYDYWIRLGDRWPPKIIDQVLAQNTQHKGTLSQRNIDRQLMEADRIRARYGFVRVAQLEVELEQSRSAAADTQRALMDIRRSEFWRATAPLRRALDYFYALRGRRS
jgi:glycosyltransferase involved in cell wall biosynthesis